MVPCRVVTWYCVKRVIELPRGRCHFGEIFLFYAPAYLILGLLFKLTLSGLRLALAVLCPVRWFVERVYETEKGHKDRPQIIVILALVAFLVVEFPLLVIDSVYDKDDTFSLVSLSAGITAIPICYIAAYLVMWSVPTFQRHSVQSSPSVLKLLSG